MTLVEVIASLALLSTLLGSAVVAKGRLTRQWSLARDRAEAVQLLDAQLQTWHAGSLENLQVEPINTNSNYVMRAGDEHAPASAIDPSDDWGMPTRGEGALGSDFMWRAEVLSNPSTGSSHGGVGSQIEVVRYTAFTKRNDERVKLATIDLLRPALTKTNANQPTLPVSLPGVSR